MRMINFYDTSSLLELAYELDKTSHFVISSITLKELENIKTSLNKSPEVKAAARAVIRFLENNPNHYEVAIYHFNRIDITDDEKILTSAKEYYRLHKNDVVNFVTNDLCLKAIARTDWDGGQVMSAARTEDNYVGFKNVIMSDEEMADFYSEGINKYGICINEYINIYNRNNELVDTQIWDGESFKHLKYTSFDSKHFGNIKPITGDVYQQMAMDSLTRNKITMLKGPAGTGKSYLALGYLISQLEKGKIDKIIVFSNPVATRGAARLGFYPGTRDEKLLDSQIGNMLISKIGGRIEVERMIEEEQLILLPFSDIRGYDTSGMKAGIYITEAQNLSKDLMKLALQRAGEDCIFIIDGDNKAQVDSEEFAGRDNGMRRVSEVFRGSDIYGEVELQQIHRSKIAQIAEQI